MKVAVVRKELGRKIREIRKLRGLTQEKLGDKANLSYQFIGELERGKVNVSFDSLFRIAQALDMHISDLFTRQKELVTIMVKEKTPFSRLTAEDLQILKKAGRLLSVILPAK
jgi:transcriptional regulator with XRE-family HTH domain